MQFVPRSGVLRSACKYHSQRLMSIPLKQLQKLVYSDQAKVLVCDLPNSGAKHFYSNLIISLEGEDALTNKSIHHKLAVPNGAANFNSQKKVLVNTMSTRLETYTKVLFHRHPLERLVDMYVSKEGFSHVNENSSDTMAAMGSYVQLLAMMNGSSDVNPRGEKKEWNMSFSQFVKYIIHSAGVSLNPWLSIYNTCMPCVYGYNTLIRWENREEESAKLINMLGINMKMPGYKTTDMTWPAYYESVDKADIRSLLHMYKYDMQIFNYTWPTV